MAIDRVAPLVLSAIPSTVAAAPSALVAGQIIEARVLALLDGGLVRLLTSAGQLEVPAKAKLVVGTQVRLEVVQDGPVQRLVLLDRPAQDHAGPTSSPAGQAAAARPAPPGPAPTPATAEAAILGRIVETAVARQTSLAPLLADLGAVTEPGRTAPLPADVERAAAAVLRFRLDADQPITARTIEGALARSGLFREALMARLGLAPAPAAPNAGAQAGAPAPGGTAPFVAPPLDPDLARALLPLAAPGDGDLPPPADLKSALVALRAVLATALGRPAAADMPEESGVRPPRRGDVPLAQPAQPPQIAPDAPPQEAMRALLAETEGALARLALSQLASSDPLPGQAAAGGRAEPAAPTFLFEVPVLAQGRTSIAQIEIGRDDGKNGAEGGSQAWRARFSVDVEPGGPVHALVVLHDAKVAVTLWAERPATAARLREDLAGFERTLAEAAFALDRVQVRTGQPDAPPTVPAQHFLDRRT